MGREIIGVDGLDGLVFGFSEVVFVLLIEGEAKLAVGVSRTRELCSDLLEIGDRFVDFTAVALDESEVVERARIVFGEREGGVEEGKSLVVFFPLDVSDADVCLCVGVVRTHLCDLAEGVDAGLVLLGVEKTDAVVVPTHPVGIVDFGGSRCGVRANGDGAGLGDHVDDRLDVVLALGLAHAEVHKMLVKAAIANSGRDRHGAAGRHGEGITDELRASGLDGVVVGDDAIVPHLVKIVERAGFVDETVGEAVS